MDQLIDAGEFRELAAGPTRIESRTNFLPHSRRWRVARRVRGRRRTSATTTDNPYAAARRITSAVSMHVSTATPTELAPAANLAAYVGVQWLMRSSAQPELGSPHTHGLCELPRTPT
jgi:hypothetical protein